MKQALVILGQSVDQLTVKRVIRLIGRAKEYRALVGSMNSSLAMRS